MREDGETTATQLQAKLAALNMYVSLGTIRHSRAQLWLDLLWVSLLPAYISGSISVSLFSETEPNKLISSSSLLLFLLSSTSSSPS